MHINCIYVHKSFAFLPKVCYYTHTEEFFLFIITEYAVSEF